MSDVVVNYTSISGRTFTMKAAAAFDAAATDPVTFDESGTLPGWYQATGPFAVGMTAMIYLGAGEWEAGMITVGSGGSLWFVGRADVNLAPIGGGARTVAITVNDGSSPLQAATVRVTQGAESLTQATNSSGIATFNLNDATWTIAITKAGYSFAGASLVVAADVAHTYSMSLIAITPSDPGATTGYVTIRTSAGVPIAGVTVQVQVTKLANGTTGSGIDDPLASGVSDADGLVEFPGLPRLATYQSRIGTGQWFRGVTLDADTTPLAGVLGLAE